MNPQEMQFRDHPQTVIDRFVASCQADDRIVAAFLGGSHARGAADEYSDLDLYLITTDDAYADFYLSHFMTALGRGQLWWAYSQLEILRRLCVNLARLRRNFSDADAGEEAYFKVEQALPVEQLAALQVTCCPMEPGAMFQAALVLVRFYRELAPVLARAHGLPYPADLERMLSDRLISPQSLAKRKGFS